MKTTTINEKIYELTNNKEFMEKVQKTTSVEEYHQLLSAYGIDTTVEELNSGFEQMASLFGENEELSDEALDTVAGGRVNAVSYLGLGGQIGCTLIMMACATNPVGWYIAACGFGAVALGSLAF